MADEHRRVEPRGVVGSGMLTDPERIEQLEHERERMERTWREPPKRKFGEVLLEAPARNPFEEEPPPLRHARRARDSEDAKHPPMEGEEQGADGEPDAQDASSSDSSDSSEAGEAGEEAPPLPRVPPDPRMARLHAMFDQAGRPRRGRERS